jgi:hypothetical protein
MQVVLDMEADPNVSNGKHASKRTPTRSHTINICTSATIIHALITNKPAP